jgi:L-2,4-diaminobutyrate decarboxylase
VPDGRDLTPLDHRADYLNAGDDSDAGLPDLLGRSLRTTRRPDILKVAVTLRALGRSGMADLVERTCAVAGELARLVADDPALELFGEPELSTVLFRPEGADGEAVASVRRRLLAEGRAVLGRARVGAPEGDGPAVTGHGQARGGTLGGVRRCGLWLKATLLNPYARRADLEALLKLVRDAVPSAPPQRPGPPGRHSPPAGTGIGTGIGTGAATATGPAGTDANGAAGAGSSSSRTGGSIGRTTGTTSTSHARGTADTCGSDHTGGSTKSDTGTPSTARRPRS